MTQYLFFIVKFLKSIVLNDKMHYARVYLHITLYVVYILNVNNLIIRR